MGRRRWVVAGAVAVPLLLVAAGLLTLKTDGKGADAVGRVPSSAASAPVVTAGWHYYRDDPAFSVPIPDGWLPVRDGRHVEFREPGGTRLLTVDEIDPPAGDLSAVARAREKADKRAATFPDHRRIAIVPVTYQVRAVDREWTYTSAAGVASHALSRTFVTSTGRAYTIGWRTAESDWTARRADLALVFDGFQSGPAVSRPPTAAPTSARPSPTPSSAVPTAAPSVPSVALPGGAIRNQATGLCLDVPDSNPDLGAPIQMWTCHATGGQQFTRPGDGTMRALDRCLQIDGTAVDSMLHLIACDGGPAQQFDLNAALDLVSLQSVLCVEVPGANRGEGVLIRTQPCSGLPQQKWIIG